jgi:photosystem II stability/assembly factor-like uncharacterized protein
MKLKKQILLAALLTVVFNCITLSQWNQFGNLGTTETFLDSRQITATTAIACGFGGRIVRTTNNGLSWLIINSGVTVPLKSMFFLPNDSTKGWISAGNGVLRTTDKGLTWNTVNTTQPMAENIFFIDNNTGWFAGSDNSVYKTTNGGESFTFSTLGGGNHRFMDVHFFGTLKGFAMLIDNANNRTFIMSTVNGGSTWITVSVIDNFKGSDFNVFGSQVIYIAGLNGKFAKTLDGGGVWTVSPVLSIALESISFANINTGYVAGGSVIQKTTDGGNTWTVQAALQAPFSFLSVSTLPNNPDIGFASGMFGTAYGTMDGGDSFTGSNNHKENSSPRSFSLGQNNPNPFNPSTIFSFSVPYSSEVQLKIYDILGKEIAAVVNERFDAGSYEINFDASHLPSGTYFYRLTAGEFTETKKMTLIK